MGSKTHGEARSGWKCRQGPGLPSGPRGHQQSPPDVGEGEREIVTLHAYVFTTELLRLLWLAGCIVCLVQDQAGLAPSGEPCPLWAPPAPPFCRGEEEQVPSLAWSLLSDASLQRPTGELWETTGGLIKTETVNNSNS